VHSTSKAITTLAAAIALTSPAQQRPTLHHITGDKAAELNDTLNHQLPAPLNTQVDQEQLFLLQPGNLTIAPASVSPDENDPHAECGVFLNSRYVPLIHPTATGFPSCETADGITLAPTGDHPALIFLFGVTYGHGPDTTMEAVLTWNTATKTYALDTALTDWLNNQKDSDTLPGAKRLIVRHLAARP